MAKILVCDKNSSFLIYRQACLSDFSTSKAGKRKKKKKAEEKGSLRQAYHLKDGEKKSHYFNLLKGNNTILYEKKS